MKALLAAAAISLAVTPALAAQDKPKMDITTISTQSNPASSGDPVFLGLLMLIGWAALY